MEKDSKQKKKRDGITLLQSVLCMLLCGLFWLLTRGDGTSELKNKTRELLSQSISFEQLTKAFSSFESRITNALTTGKGGNETEQEAQTAKTVKLSDKKAGAVSNGV